MKSPLSVNLDLFKVITQVNAAGFIQNVNKSKLPHRQSQFQDVYMLSSVRTARVLNSHSHPSLTNSVAIKNRIELNICFQRTRHGRLPPPSVAWRNVTMNEFIFWRMEINLGNERHFSSILGADATSPRDGKIFATISTRR